MLAMSPNSRMQVMSGFFGSYDVDVILLDLIHILQTANLEQKSIKKTFCQS